jgi:hypothetical protein
MSVIIKRTFPGKQNQLVTSELIKPVVYVDSLTQSSYIYEINNIMMQTIRELNKPDSSESKYGSSNLSSLLVSSKKQISFKDPGYWILKNETNDSYKVTLYEHVKYPGYVMDSYEITEICEIYYVKCGRTVPRIVKKQTKFEKFESELENAVLKHRVSLDNQ